MIINNKDLANSLVALALMCTEEDTDNCDLTITTSNGKLKVHIEFDAVEDKE